jgi:hypothetical protein
MLLDLQCRCLAVDMPADSALHVQSGNTRLSGLGQDLSENETSVFVDKHKFAAIGWHYQAVQDRSTANSAIIGFGFVMVALSQFCDSGVLLGRAL